jgi:hypothetical protein
VNIDELQAAWNAMYDGEILRHGYTDYQRDYDFIMWSPYETAPFVWSRYRLTHCVEVDVRPALSDETWRLSVDDLNLDLQRWSTDDRARGHVWVPSHAIERAEVLGQSERAQRRAAAIGVPCHEMKIKTNVQQISLAFSDLVVSQVDPPAVPDRANRGS